MNTNQTLIVIVGPTGVGKTELCLQIARHFNTKIINADSRQIFQELPIGTAAPTEEQRRQVFHHLVGTHHITDYYSAAKFEEDVLRIIQQHFATSHSPIILSGGSMMYIDAVCNGIDDIPNINENTRELYKRKLKEEGLEKLCEELKCVDPEYYQIVDRKNTRRVIHALEICHQTGKPYTSFRTQQKKERPFHIIKVGINLPREELYERINQRVLKMIENGFIDEARSLYGKHYLNALQTVGYKELFKFFEGTWTLEEAIERIQGNTRRYARKQLTWFKRDSAIRWFSPENPKEIINYIETSLSKNIFL